MYGLTRGTMTLIGVAAAGALLWLASQVEADANGDYWARMALLAGAGLVMALSQLLGGWTKWGWPRLSRHGVRARLPAGARRRRARAPGRAAGLVPSARAWAADLGVDGARRRLHRDAAGGGVPDRSRLRLRLRHDRAGRRRGRGRRGAAGTGAPRSTRRRRTSPSRPSARRAAARPADGRRVGRQDQRASLRWWRTETATPRPPTGKSPGAAASSAADRRELPAPREVPRGGEPCHVDAGRRSHAAHGAGSPTDATRHGSPRSLRRRQPRRPLRPGRARRRPELAQRLVGALRPRRRARRGGRTGRCANPDTTDTISAVAPSTSRRRHPEEEEEPEPDGPEASAEAGIDARGPEVHGGRCYTSASRVPWAVVGPKKFAEPVAVSSTESADFRLPPTATGRGFDLLPLRARRKGDTTGRRRPPQGCRGRKSPQFATSAGLNTSTAFRAAVDNPVDTVREGRR